MSPFTWFPSDILYLGNRPKKTTTHRTAQPETLNAVLDWYAGRLTVHQERASQEESQGKYSFKSKFLILPLSSEFPTTDMASQVPHSRAASLTCFSSLICHQPTSHHLRLASGGLAKCIIWLCSLFPFCRHPLTKSSQFIHMINSYHPSKPNSDVTSYRNPSNTPPSPSRFSSAQSIL